MSNAKFFKQDYDKKLQQGERFPITVDILPFKCHVCSVIPNGRKNRISLAQQQGDSEFSIAIVMNTLRNSETGDYVFIQSDKRDLLDSDSDLMDSIALEIISAVPWLQEETDKSPPVDEKAVAVKNSKTLQNSSSTST